MNKGDLVLKMSEVAGISKKDAENALNALVEAIEGALKKDDKVAITGFGTFAVSTRKERVGRNPQTGEEIKIAASKSPKFKPGKLFKDMFK